MKQKNVHSVELDAGFVLTLFTFPTWFLPIFGDIISVSHWKAKCMPTPSSPNQFNIYDRASKDLLGKFFILSHSSNCQAINSSFVFSRLTDSILLCYPTEITWPFEMVEHWQAWAKGLKQIARRGPICLNKCLSFPGQKALISPGPGYCSDWKLFSAFSLPT